MYFGVIIKLFEMSTLSKDDEEGVFGECIESFSLLGVLGELGITGQSSSFKLRFGLSNEELSLFINVDSGVCLKDEEHGEYDFKSNRPKT